MVCRCWYFLSEGRMLVCFLGGDVSIKNKIISVASSGNESDSSWLFHHISQIRLNDSFHRNTNLLVVVGVGGGQTRRRDQHLPPPLCHPITFQPPTSAVGGSVITIYDRDSDPQRSWASHPIPDRELRRWASKVGALWIPDERINWAWETRRGSRCVCV